MSGEITIKKGGGVSQRRPSWKHSRPADEWPGYESANIEMLESIRNVLEEIKGSQMLQCDVRQMIEEIRRSAERTRKALERIDRRLAKVEKLR